MVILMMKGIASRIKKVAVYLSVFSVLATSVFSVFSQIQLKPSAMGAGSTKYYVWEGADFVVPSKVSYAGGSGSVHDPYLVSNGDQLYKMVYEQGRTNFSNGESAYFRLTNDIYLNDIKNFSSWSDTTAGLNDWFVKEELYTKEFAGHIDGSNFTVYGLFTKKNTSVTNAAASLIPVVSQSSGCSVKNLNIANVYIKTNVPASALFGQVKGNASVVRSSVHNVKIYSSAYAAGMAAQVWNANVDFTDCIVHSISGSGSIFGFVGRKFDGYKQFTVSLKNCISMGYHPASYFNNTASLKENWVAYSYENVLTDRIESQNGSIKVNTTYIKADGTPSQPSATGSLYSVTQSQVKAQNNDNIMSSEYGFDFINIWLATGQYPVLRSADVWDGVNSGTNYDKSIFTVGDGTKESPYLISNGDQLYAMVSLGGDSAYYKLTCDIYLNDVKSVSVSDIPKADLNDWMSSSKISEKSFSGHIDGAYHSIYGLYTSAGTAALIPFAEKAEIVNLGVAKAYITGETAAGIVGKAVKNADVSLVGCSVVDSLIFATEINGGIVGEAAGKVKLNKCYSYDLTISPSDAFGGLVGRVKSDESSFTDCYSAGNYPVGDGIDKFDSANTKNVYTDVSGGGVFKVLSGSAFKGERALDEGNLSFTAKSDWQLTTYYPVLRVKISDKNAEKIWKGNSDSSWSKSGSGESDDPYIISTPAQLYNMISSTVDENKSYEGKYFELGDDIYLNSVVYSDWYKIAENGWVDADTTYFKGTLDGANHTVYGLYINSDKQNLGLFPTVYGNATIKRLNISNAYIVGNGAANQCAGALIGRVCDGSATVSKCTVDYNVFIGARTSGGVVGCGGKLASDKTLIEYCSFVGSFINDMSNLPPSYKGGLIGNCVGTVTAGNSFTTAAAAFGSGSATCKPQSPVYQTGSVGLTTAIRKVAAQDMFGSKAVTAMPGLSWGDTWMATATYPAINNRNYAVWSGGIASSYDAGSGTESDPYIIKTAEQLAKMVSSGGKNAQGAAAYFAVADGVDAIYINDVANLSAAQAKDYLMSDVTVKEWLYNSQKFVGNFNGNGVTIYGIYNNSESKRGGLLGTLNTGAMVYNVNLSNCVVISTDNSTYAGVLSSGTEPNAMMTVKSVSVSDSYVRGRWAGGLIGNATSSTLEITNCLVKNVDVDYNGKGITNGGGAGGAGALLSDGAWGTATVTITDCLTIGSYPVCYYRPNPQTERFIISDVYTDIKLSDMPDYNSISAAAKERFETIKTLSTAQLTGTDAPKNNMAFDWNRAWDTTQSYPVLKRYVINNGTPGAVWSGMTADNFIGAGTKNNPFIVDTAERFAKMAVSPVANAYYLVTQDIRLNDVSSSDWCKASGLNIWMPSEKFNANVSGYNNETGSNITVYGVYQPNVTDGSYGGLFSTLSSNTSVKNINLANAYFCGTATTADTVGSSIGAIAGAIAQSASNVMISGCMVDDSVIINTSANASGILGCALGVGVISDCASNVTLSGNIAVSGGLVATADAVCNIMNSYSIGNVAVGKGCKVLNVYSDTPQSQSVAAAELEVVLLKKAQMTGEAAKDNMVGFDFEGIWSVTDRYPVICGITPPFDGTPGEVWTGLTAQNYAGGSGTQSDPYLIATGEQLYKLVTSTNIETKGKYYKLINDIKLNDIYSENWEEKIGLTPWFTSMGGNNSFAGNFDGDYHIVSGLFYESSDRTNFYAGLFPLVDQGAVIQNTGMTDCYIAVSTVLPNTFAACFAGNTTNYGYKTDEYGVRVLMSPQEFEAGGGKVPLIRNCFADHTTYCTARYAGGIISGVQNFVYVDNCFFTGYVDGGDAIQSGAIVGDAWGVGTRITNCYSASINMSNFSGNIRVLNAKTDEEIYIRNCYALSYRSILNVVLLPFEREKYGGLGVMEYAPGLDWENVWSAIEGGTPVLRGFDKNGHTLDEFSYKGGYSSTITFVTNADGITIEPITGEVLSPLKLPTPERYGYTFGGWYVYSELDVPYDKDYMPYRDLTLYAKWTLDGIYQTFENYPNTAYDVGEDHRLYRPGIKNYNTDNVHGGGKSMHRIGESDKESDFLINYEDTLKVGSQYVMTYWVRTDTKDASVKLSLVHNTWPDIDEPVSKVETMLQAKKLGVGEWKQYTYTFTATSPWVSIRSSGNAGLYFDDIMLVPTGLSSITASGIAKTSDNSVSLEIVFSVFAVAFVIFAASKRRIDDVMVQ